jgi:cytochrome b
MSSTVQKMWIQVGDPLVRYWHWALVVAFAIGWLSADQQSGGPDQLHIWAGYAVAIVVAVKLPWRLVGTRHARFSDLACSPATAQVCLAYMLRGRWALCGP